MAKHYLDYFWENGMPNGIYPVDNQRNENTFTIIMDPYRKRISVEKYKKEEFSSVVYDSSLLDFRKLKPVHQVAWQKIMVSKDQSLIRDQDDRVVLFESYIFHDDLCRECRISSPHGLFLATQKMYYESLGDPFNGVILYDRQDYSVMLKRYETDKHSGMFTKLLEENWNGKDCKQQSPSLRGD